MGMTMTQKILAAHAGLDSVSAGQLLLAKLDLVLGNDIARLSMDHRDAKASRAQCLTVDTQHFAWCIISNDEITATVEHTREGLVNGFVQLDKQLPFSLS